VQGLREILLDHGLGGRTERRLPIVVVVRLAHCDPAGTDGEEERTYTDNISPHGARVFSKRPWQLGDAVRVTPLNGDSACGKVVHCKRLPDDRYSIGVKFPTSPAKWSALQRYGSPIE
jgi:PilZ domain